MGVCWYCHWGWPKVVADIYKVALTALDGYDSPLHYGPAHIVWEDENFNHAEWCLEHFDENKGDLSDYTLGVVRWSLEELAKIPMNERAVAPEAYYDDDEHPEKYPPASGIEMVMI